MVGVESTDEVECLGLVGHADVDRVAAVVACQANVCQPEQGKLRDRHERTDVVAEQCRVVADDLDVRFEPAQRVAIIVALLDHLRRPRTVIAHVELLADFIPAQQDLSHTPRARDPAE